MTNLGDIILVTLLLGVAALGVLRPVIIIRWAKTAHPDIPEDNKTILWIARFIGVGVMGIALFILGIIVRPLLR